MSDKIDSMEDVERDHILNTFDIDEDIETTIEELFIEEKGEDRSEEKGLEEEDIEKVDFGTVTELPKIPTIVFVDENDISHIQIDFHDTSVSPPKPTSSKKTKSVAKYVCKNCKKEYVRQKPYNVHVSACSNFVNEENEATKGKLKP